MAERIFRREMLRGLSFFGLALSVVILLIFIYLPGYTRIRELQENKAEVKRQIQALNGDIKDLAVKNKLVKNNDPYFLEKLAREHLGMVKENEAIVDFTTEE